MLSLRRLLAAPSLELTLVFDPGGRALDRELLWLHPTELPDPSSYVRAGELVLTNGVWLDQTTPDRFVDAVDAAGGAGIVFGLRSQVPAPPPELEAVCRRHGLPLVTISERVPFTAMTSAAAAMLAEHRVAKMTGSVRRGGALASVVSRGLGAKGVLDVVRRDHELPLVVIDRSGRELAASPSGLAPGQLRAAAAHLSKRPPPLEADLEGLVASVFLVAAVGEIDAALLCLRPYAELDDEQLAALSQACTYLSLEIAKRQAVHAIEQRFAGELLEMVQSGRHRESDVAERLRAFGLDPASPIAAMAVCLGATGDRAMPDVSATLHDVFVVHGLPALVASGTADVRALVAWASRPRLSLVDVATEVQRRVAETLPGARVLVGLGGVSGGADDLRDVLLRARETCRAMRGSSQGPVVQSFSQLDSYRVLLGMLDRDALARFAHSLLDPVREHDRDRGGELEATLRTFLELDGNYTDTSERLHVHVNTLRNRLARLAALTGRDPRRTSDRVDLFLALEADASAAPPQPG